MSLNDLIFYIQCGDEIEFHIDEKRYFLQPDFDSLNKYHSKNEPAYNCYVIYDSCDYENPTELFSGNIDKILNFNLYKGYTLNNNFEKFVFDCIF